MTYKFRNTRRHTESKEENDGHLLTVHMHVDCNIIVDTTDHEDSPLAKRPKRGFEDILSQMPEYAQLQVFNLYSNAFNCHSFVGRSCKINVLKVENVQLVR